MTPLPSARKRAEEFADAVDALLVGATAGSPGSTAPSPLLDVVLALREVPEPEPRPAFTADLRRRLVAEAAALASEAAAATPVDRSTAHQVHHLPPHPTRHHPGRLVAAATVLVVVGGSAGVTTASRRAVPGDALYPVKRAIEGAELQLSVNDHGRGQDLLEQASHRLEEVHALLPEAGSALPSTVAARLPETVHAFQQQAVQGTTLLLDSFQEDRDPHTVVEVRTFASDSVETLTGLAATAPSDVLPDLGGAAVALQAVDARALALCASCDDRAPLVVPQRLGDAAQPHGEDHVTASGPTAPQASPAGVESPSADPSSLLSDETTAPPVDPTDGSTTTPGATGTPTDTPTDSPTGTATDPATGTPTDSPTSGSSEEPGTTPTDTPTTGASEEPTDSVPTDTPTGTTPDPTEVSSSGGTGPTGDGSTGGTSAPPTDSTGSSTDPLDQADPFHP